MALAPNDNLSDPACSPEYPASVAFVLRKTRQLRAEIGIQIEQLELVDAQLLVRIQALEADVALKITDKGESTVAQLNSMQKAARWVFHLSDSGTLAVGSVPVRKGDTVLWNGTAWVVTGRAAPDVSDLQELKSGDSIGAVKTLVNAILGRMKGT